MLPLNVPQLGHYRQPDQLKKNFNKCARCRSDKVACNPPNRDYTRHKCDRCHRMGYECGPSERAPRRERRRRFPLGLDNFVHYPPQTAEREIEHADTSVPLDNTVRQERAGRPLVTIPLVNVHASMPTSEEPAPSRKASEAEAKKVVAKLGDQNALKELLHFGLNTCDKVEQWTGSAEVVQETRAALESALKALDRDFKATWEHVSGLATRDLGHMKGHVLTQAIHMLRKYRSRQKQNVVEEREDFCDEGLVYETLYQLQKRQGEFSVADYLCSGALSNTLHRRLHPNTLKEIVDSYHQASSDIGKILSELCLDNMKHRNLLLGRSLHCNPLRGETLRFPPCHIACRFANHNVLFRLWKASPTSAQQPWEIDCLCMTPAHIAAYTGRLHELDHIFKHEKSTVTNVGKDVFGLTPIQITACRDDVNGFSLLFKLEADHRVLDSLDRSILALAARNRSANVVRFILDLGIMKPSLKHEVREAIEAGHSDIVHLLLQHPLQSYSMEEVEACRAAAMQRGFFDILDQLEGLVSWADPQQASDSLEDATYTAYFDQHEDLVAMPGPSQTFDSFGLQSRSFTPMTSFSQPFGLSQYLDITSVHTQRSYSHLDNPG